MKVFSYNKSSSMTEYFRNRMKIEKLLKVLGIESSCTSVDDYSRLEHQHSTELCKVVLESLQEGDILLVPELRQLTFNIDELLSILREVSSKNARLLTSYFDSGKFCNEWDFLMLEGLLKFSNVEQSNIHKDEESEKKSVEYPTNMFEIACEYINSKPIPYILRKYKLNMYSISLKRLCDEFLGDFIEVKDFGTNSEEFKSKIVNVIKI